MRLMNHSKVPILLHNQVISCLKKHISLANLFFKTDINEPLIQYKNKGSIAGSAILSKWQIQINSIMLIEHKLDFIYEVIPHELAHLIVYQQYGRVSPHGKEWQFVMQAVFNCVPKCTHEFTIPLSIQKKRYRYICQCQDYWLTTIRHNRIQHQKAKYYCKLCHTLLQLNKNDVNNSE